MTYFTYLGSVVDAHGGTDRNIKIMVGQTITSFNMLKKVLNAREISKSPKLRIFTSDGRAVLFAEQKHG